MNLYEAIKVISGYMLYALAQKVVYYNTVLTASLAL